MVLSPSCPPIFLPKPEEVSRTPLVCASRAWHVTETVTDVSNAGEQIPFRFLKVNTVSLPDTNANTLPETLANTVPNALHQHHIAVHDLYTIGLERARFSFRPVNA